ncbi:MAG: NADH-quinone oxidoreductase subunit NuoK [Leptospiraceae bacterium]|nr:NADH-quinone oxidoreductase subunit NuoK [Leptospiraceae bacterium]
MQITTEHYLILSAIVFSIGIIGVLLRRNIFTVFMSIELMLNSTNLVLIAYARQWQEMSGQTAVLFVIAVAAAEICVGLAIVIALYRQKGNIDLNIFTDLKG